MAEHPSLNHRNLQSHGGKELQIYSSMKIGSDNAFQRNCKVPAPPFKCQINCGLNIDRVTLVLYAPNVPYYCLVNELANAYETSSFETVSQMHIL